MSGKPEQKTNCVIDRYRFDNGARFERLWRYTGHFVIESAN
jgi:hypothetical protein